MTHRDHGAGARRIFALFLAAACVLAPIAACQVIAGIEDRSTPVTSITVDGGKDTGVPIDTDGAPPPLDATCMLAHFESTDPQVDAGPDDYDLTIIAAFSTVRLPGTRDASASDFPGYDLDNVCTCCDGGCSTANLATCVNTLTPGSVACDGVGGSDNATAPLNDTYGMFSTHFTEAKINAAIAAGQATVLMQVRHWNGYADDETVELSFLTSPGATGPDGGLLGDSGVPRFNGTDTWSYAENSVLPDTPDGEPPTNYPTFHSNQAYVAGNVLYARLSTLYIVLGDLPLQLTDVAISGQIQANGGKLYSFVGGVFSARWPSQDVLAQFAPKVLVNCDLTDGGSVEYQFLKSSVCAAADLTSDPTKGGNGIDPPTNPCDALSLQLGFESTAVQFGGPQPSVPLPNACPNFADKCQ